MAPINYLDAMNRAMNAELMQWGAADLASTGSRWRGRTIAALVLGATTAVGVADDAAAAVPAAPSTTEALAPGAVVPVRYRPAPDAADLTVRALETARWRVGSASDPGRAVATLALEIGRLQRDLASRAKEGMEEWVGEAYAALEAVRRAVGDTVVDDEDAAVVAVALDRAAELLTAA